MNLGRWRRSYNRKLQVMMKLAPITNCIKGQRIQWLGHTLKREENDHLQVAFEWKPVRNRLRGIMSQKEVD